MSMPTTKFNIGETVYKPARNYSDKRISCPDCLGTRVWTIVFADGHAEEVMCQTCKVGFSPASGVVHYKEWSPYVDTLTIGQIYGWDPINGMRYMCDETGVGSGTIHNETDFFHTHEEAMKKAQELHIEGMKSIARNNFSKKFKGKKQIEEMLSSFGFQRRVKLEKARQFAQWAKLSGVIKGV